MTSGGARARSGPGQDPMSAKSLRENRQFVQLPHVYRGYVPVWPLNKPGYRPTEDETPEAIADAIEQREKLELDYWKKLWRKPQADQWAQLDMKFQVARYVRAFIESTQTGANASMIAQVSRMEDALGLSMNGLRQLGWQISPKPEKKNSRSPKPETEKPAKRSAGRQTSTGTWLEGVTVDRGA